MILPDFHYLLYVEWLAEALGKIYFPVVTYLDQALNHCLCGWCLFRWQQLSWTSLPGPSRGLRVCGPSGAAAGSAHNSHCTPQTLLFQGPSEQPLTPRARLPKGRATCPEGDKSRPRWDFHKTRRNSHKTHRDFHQTHRDFHQTRQGF